MAQDSQRWGWPVWPEALQQPDSPAVQQFLSGSAASRCPNCGQAKLSASILSRVTAG
jgi:uncharacterized protein (DUF983 family)